MTLKEGDEPPVTVTFCPGTAVRFMPEPFGAM